jgi:hypothetical protein
MKYLLLLSLIFFLGFSCHKNDPDQTARDNSILPDTMEEDIQYDLPPVEFLQDNYQMATQVLLIKVSKKETADQIYADDGEIGYIVQQLTGKVLKVYKGNNKTGEEITYFNFLEYYPGIEERSVDSVLVFLQKDAETGQIVAIEAGQFGWDKKLSVLMEKVMME